MREVVTYLTSLAQALAKMSLYAPGHPSRQSAANASWVLLQALQETGRQVNFSFLGDEVIYGDEPVRELKGWDWSRKLSVAGVQRLEFRESVAAEEYRVFLESLLPRLARARTVDGGYLDARTPAGGSEPIRFGSVGVRDARVTPAEPIETPPAAPGESVDFSPEAYAVEWLHDEVQQGRGLALAEAEIVVQTLAASMHAGHRMLLPLLQLKEFDQYTTTHAMNVAVLSMALAERLGLSTREVHFYGMAGLLHDLGKVKVPLEILRKPGGLTPSELRLMRQHPVDGARLILQKDHRLDLCATVAFEHHIMIDGGGYPARTRRCNCHHASMLVHVCDVYDALRTNRPYRVAWEPDAILGYLRERIGLEFEPTVATEFLALVAEAEIVAAHADSLEEQPLTVA